MAWHTAQAQAFLNQYGQRQNLPADAVFQQQPDVDITVAIPHTGNCSMAWAMAFRQMQLPPRVKFMTLSGQPWDKTRNLMAEQAAGSHLFMMDSDVIPPPDVIPRLMRHNVDMVTGIYWRREVVPVPGIYRYYENMVTPLGRGGHRAIVDFPQNALFEIDVAGAGCLLIKRDVFNRIPKSGVRDWYIKHYGDTPMSRNIPDGWFYFGTVAANQMSEDFIFMHVAKEYGIKLYCDSSVKCQHILPSRVGEQGFQVVDSG